MTNTHTQTHTHSQKWASRSRWEFNSQNFVQNFISVKEQLMIFIQFIAQCLCKMVWPPFWGQVRMDTAAQSYSYHCKQCFTGPFPTALYRYRNRFCSDCGIHLRWERGEIVHQIQKSVCVWGGGGGGGGGWGGGGGEHVVNWKLVNWKQEGQFSPPTPPPNSWIIFKKKGWWQWGRGRGGGGEPQLFIAVEKWKHTCKQR